MRILNYWSQDLSKGIQYKIITSVNPEGLSPDKLQDVQDDFLDGIYDIARITKENAITDTTFDISIWCDHEQYPNARAVYKAITASFATKQNVLSIKQVNRNRKLLILNIQ